MSKRRTEEGDAALVDSEGEELVFEDPFDDDEPVSEEEEEEVDGEAEEEDADVDGAAAAAGGPASGPLSSSDAVVGLASDAAVDAGEEEEGEGEKRVWRPGVDVLAPDEVLEVSPEAYVMLHALTPQWPCLSFDFMPDKLGAARSKFPHAAFIVAGTQADKPSNNRICVMKVSDLARTQFDDGE